MMTMREEYFEGHVVGPCPCGVRHAYTTIHPEAPRLPSARWVNDITCAGCGRGMQGKGLYCAACQPDEPPEYDEDDE